MVVTSSRIGSIFTKVPNITALSGKGKQGISKGLSFVLYVVGEFWQ